MSGRMFTFVPLPQEEDPIRITMPSQIAVPSDYAPVS